MFGGYVDGSAVVVDFSCDNFVAAMIRAVPFDLVIVVGWLEAAAVVSGLAAIVSADEPSFAAEANVVAAEVDISVSAEEITGVGETAVVDEPVGLGEGPSLETAVATVEGSTLIAAQVSDVVAADRVIVVIVGGVASDSAVVIIVEANEINCIAAIVIVVGTATGANVAGFVDVCDVALAFAIGQIALVSA